jgi:hypothetical protein
MAQLHFNHICIWQLRLRGNEKYSFPLLAFQCSIWRQSKLLLDVRWIVTATLYDKTAVTGDINIRRPVAVKELIL